MGQVGGPGGSLLPPAGGVRLLLMLFFWNNNRYERPVSTFEEVNLFAPKIRLNDVLFFVF